MTAVARAGWALGALYFATLLTSIAHVDYVSTAPLLLLLSFAVLAAVRPAIAIPALAAAIPVASYLFAQRWHAGVPWAEPLVCAALSGLCANAAVTTRAPLPFLLRAPAILFAAIVAAAVISALCVPALRLGSGFRDALATHLLREYFTDLGGFPALHTGMLLLEGVLLLALSARIATGSRALTLRASAAATAAGATAAAALNLGRLYTAASRAEHFWDALVQLSRTLRWNVHYADFNAAGSYFAMAVLAGAALASTARTVWTRTLWVACTLTIACGLWLTASRAAYLALIVAAAGAAGAVWLLRSGHRLAAGAAVATATIAVVLVIAIAAPMRGNQHSPFIAADVRLGMAAVASRMIASEPVFGIGPGEFYRRSGEFATPQLIAKFPVAVHENAHNNFLQIAAELGVIGGVAFVALVFAALYLAARGASADRARLMVVAGLAAFVITWLGGHPLLVPEPAYAFWVLLGVSAGTGAASNLAREAHGLRRGSTIVALCAIAVLATVPWRMRALTQAADLEHLGIGVSPHWQLSPDDVRYREAEGRATLFVPTGMFRFSVNPRTDTPVRLEIKLDGRVADIVTLAPRRWNKILLPARTWRTPARFAAMELHIVDGDRIGMWITKVEGIQ